MPNTNALYQTLDQKRAQGAYGARFRTVASLFTTAALQDIGYTSPQKGWTQRKYTSVGEWQQKATAQETSQAIEQFITLQERRLRNLIRNRGEKAAHAREALKLIPLEALHLSLFEKGILGTYNDLQRMPIKTEQPVHVETLNSNTTPNQAQASSTVAKPEEISQAEDGNNQANTSKDLAVEAPRGLAENAEPEKQTTTLAEAAPHVQQNIQKTQETSQETADEMRTRLMREMGMSPTQQGEQERNDENALTLTAEKNKPNRLTPTLNGLAGFYATSYTPLEILRGTAETGTAPRVSTVVPVLQLQGQIPLSNTTSEQEKKTFGHLASQETNIIVAGNIRPHFNYEQVIRYLPRTAVIEHKHPIWKQDDGIKSLSGQITFWAGSRPVDHPFFSKAKLYNAQLKVSCECTSSNLEANPPLEVPSIFGTATPTISTGANNATCNASTEPNPIKAPSNTAGLFYHDFNEASYTGLGVKYETQKHSFEIIGSPKALPKLRSSGFKGAPTFVNPMKADALAIRTQHKLAPNLLALSQITSFGDNFRLTGVLRGYSQKTGHAAAFGIEYGRYRNAITDMPEKTLNFVGQIEGKFSPNVQWAILASGGRLMETQQNYGSIQINLQARLVKQAPDLNLALLHDTRFGPSVQLGLIKEIKW
jgi:hypothetical protein